MRVSNDCFYTQDFEVMPNLMQSQDLIRQEIADQTKAFLSAGGTIERVGIIRRDPKPGSPFSVSAIAAQGYRDRGVISRTGG